MFIHTLVMLGSLQNLLCVGSPRQPPVERQLEISVPVTPTNSPTIQHDLTLMIIGTVSGKEK